MEVVLLVGLLLSTAVAAVLGALVVSSRAEGRRPGPVEPPLPASVQSPPPPPPPPPPLADAAATGPSAGDESVQRALALAIDGLRADREADLQRNLDTVLALAGDKLGAQLAAGEGQLDRRNETISLQLEGLSGELRRVNDVVAHLQRERAEQHGQLLSGLQETVRQSQSVAATTQSLREVLSSSRTRGQWGERMADDVLRLAGFTEGVNYVRQRALRGGTIPDFTFLLPGGWLLHMDVKFPMDNYVRHLNATGEAEGRAAASQFLRDVRDRVRSLSGRGYVEAGTTLDFVLLFIPNEATYGFVHSHDAGLADEALGQRVVLCSPFTLFAVLAVVRQAVDSFALQRSTDEILELLGRFSVQWDKFSDAMDTVGRRLDSAGKAFEDLSGTRRRQLQRLVDRVDDLRRSEVDAGEGSAPCAVAAAPAPTAEPSADGPRPLDGPTPHVGAPEPLPLATSSPRPRRRGLVDVAGGGPDGADGEPEAADAAVRSLARRLTG